MIIVVMKVKKLIPYLLSILLGTVFGLFMFKQANFNFSDVIKTSITATGFQLGVYNDLSGAKELKEKYPNALILKDDDVYRVYYSILTNKEAINKMTDYLDKEKVAFYSKTITISDESLISSLNNYEKVIKDGNDDVLVSINKLIMASYKGEIQ